MPKQFISKDLLVEKAYQIAERDGLSALSVRKLAASCGISTGALYTYFPTKCDLTTAVIHKLYANLFFDDFCIVTQPENFVGFLRRLHASLQQVTITYQDKWLSEVSKLSHQERAAGKQVEDELFHHMEKGLSLVLSQDPDIPEGRLTGAFEPSALAAFTLDSLLSAARFGKDCETLFALLEETLYRPSSSDL